MKPHRRNYSSVLKYADRVKNNVYGQLATTESAQNVAVLDEDAEFQPSRHERLHPHTLMGKNGASKMVSVPPELCNVISETTKKYQNVQELRRAAAQYFLGLQQTNAHQPTKDKIDVDAHLNAVFLHSYGSLHNVLHELKRRVGDDWKPDSVLEVGFGPATGILALNELNFWQPSKKECVVIGHPMMTNRAKELLKSQDSTTGSGARLLQHLPGRGTQKYDLIIATHQLYRSDFHFPASVDDHASHLLSLLGPNGVLVLVERGDPKGFESIARARQIMFRPEDHVDDPSKIPREYKTPIENESLHLKILAPCSHHGKCPLQVGLDLRKKASNPGFFNWCKFGQMVQRPKFTQELKKGKYLANEWDELTPGQGPGGKHLAGSGRPFGLSFETATHSYLIVQRHKDDEQVLTPQDSWPRIMRTPMKRDKHVIMEVCAPNAQIEQWTVTKKFDKQCYHDARKASGGDLWALKAKTVQQRGGNRKSLAKSDKIESKKRIEAERKGPKTHDKNDQHGNIIVDSAYSSGGGGGGDTQDQSLEHEFDRLGKEFQSSHKYKRQIRKEMRSR